MKCQKDKKKLIFNSRQL